jgi:hypothetical protein
MLGGVRVIQCSIVAKWEFFWSFTEVGSKKKVRDANMVKMISPLDELKKSGYTPGPTAIAMSRDIEGWL